MCVGFIFFVYQLSSKTWLLSYLYLLSCVWFMDFAYIYIYLLFSIFSFFFYLFGFPFFIFFLLFSFHFLFFYFLISFLFYFNSLIHLFIYLLIYLSIIILKSVFASWICHRTFFAMEVFSTRICLLGLVLEVSVYCIMCRFLVTVIDGGFLQL